MTDFSGYMMGSSSIIESISTRQHYQTIVVVAPAPDLHSHGAGFTFTQLRNKFGEGNQCLVSANVLTLGAVERHDHDDDDESIFSISSFFSKLENYHE